MGQTEDFVWLKNKKTNKNIALIMLIIMFLQVSGIFALLGMDLSTIDAQIGFPFMWLFETFSIFWILVGLFRKNIGQ